MGGKIRAGVVGCGGISSRHAEAYIKNENCELVSVADKDPGKARARGEQYGVKWYEDAGRMYREEKLEAVSVCTPPGAHKDVVIEALENGISVLCEKPLSSNLKDAREMTASAKKNGVILLVANCHIFHPQIIRLKKVMARGDIGAITSYRNRFNWYHKNPDTGKIRGGALLDNGIHSIYLFRHIAGSIARAAAFFDPAVADISGIQKCYAMVESTGGVPGIIELDAFCSKANDRGGVIEVFGEKGSAVVDYAGESYYMKENEEGRISLEGGDELPGRFEGEVRHFSECLLNGGSSPIDGISGVNDLAAAEAIFQAGKNSTTVRIKEVAA